MCVLVRVRVAARTVATAFISSRLDYCNALLRGLPNTLLCKLQSVQNATARLITGTRRCDHITPRTPLATHQRACQVQTSMLGSPVAVRAVACLPSRWLSPRLGQHMSLSVVSRCPDVRGTTNLQQLWRQNLCSCCMDLGCGTHYQSSCIIQTSATDGSDDSWRVISSGMMNTALCDLRYASAIEKRFTYLLTSLHKSLLWTNGYR